MDRVRVRDEFRGTPPCKPLPSPRLVRSSKLLLAFELRRCLRIWVAAVALLRKQLGHFRTARRREGGFVARTRHGCQSLCRPLVCVRVAAPRLADKRKSQGPIWEFRSCNRNSRGFRNGNSNQRLGGTLTASSRPSCLHRLKVTRTGSGISQ